MRKKISNRVLPFLLLLFSAVHPLQLNAQLKSIVYDFDGLDLGASDLPEGDYQMGDLTGSISANPLPPSDMIGDRCFHLTLKGGTGSGSFGRGIARYIEFDVNADQFNFYFYNPLSNTQNAVFDVLLLDDDDKSHAFEGNMDDVFRKSFNIPPSSDWKLYAVPLKDFSDANTAGNGILDMAFTNDAGMLLSVEFKFTTVAATKGDYYLDMLAFSEGALPQGNTALSLPSKSAEDYCLLGAYSNEQNGKYHLTPGKFEALFTGGPDRHLKYVNTFLHWAYGTSTTPVELAGSSAQTLLNNGYVPIITWEPMYAGYDRLDPLQPRLQNILNGEFDAYIDLFADDIKKLSDTIIIRLMHEFEGDWYPWSICKNGNDPEKYKQTFQYFVNRFKARGTGNVKWMWCLNSDYAPYEVYNFAIKAYPGDAFVDIVANDIYNNHYPLNLPWWRSFRWQMTESYYYLTKYIPNKPLFVCEVGCRERLQGENTQSESKGAWYARMDKELQSNYRKTRALVFFHAAPDQNWLVNSSPFALESLQENFWNDDYYFRKTMPPIAGEPQETSRDAFAFPNPLGNKLYWGLVSETKLQQVNIKIYNSLGMLVFTEDAQSQKSSYSAELPTEGWSPGFYFIRLQTRQDDEKEKNARAYHFKVLKN